MPMRFLSNLEGNLEYLVEMIPATRCAAITSGHVLHPAGEDASCAAILDESASAAS